MDPLNPSLNPSLFADAGAPENLAALAASLAPKAAPGHYDELRERVTPQAAPAERAGTAEPADDDADTLAPAWTHFFEELGPGGFADLPRRAQSLARQVRDNGVTYNVYAEAGGSRLRASSCCGP